MSGLLRHGPLGPRPGGFTLGEIMELAGDGGPGDSARQQVEMMTAEAKLPEVAGNSPADASAFCWATGVVRAKAGNGVFHPAAAAAAHKTAFFASLRPRIPEKCRFFARRGCGRSENAVFQPLAAAAPQKTGFFTSPRLRLPKKRRFLCVLGQTFCFNRQNHRDLRFFSQNMPETP